MKQRQDSSTSLFTSDISLSLDSRTRDWLDLIEEIEQDPAPAKDARVGDPPAAAVHVTAAKAPPVGDTPALAVGTPMRVVPAMPDLAMAPLLDEVPASQRNLSAQRDFSELMALLSRPDSFFAQVLSLQQDQVAPKPSGEPPAASPVAVAAPTPTPVAAPTSTPVAAPTPAAVAAPTPAAVAAVAAPTPAADGGAVTPFVSPFFPRPSAVWAHQVTAEVSSETEEIEAPAQVAPTLAPSVILPQTLPLPVAVPVQTLRGPIAAPGPTSPAAWQTLPLPMEEAPRPAKKNRGVAYGVTAVLFTAVLVGLGLYIPLSRPTLIPEQPPVAAVPPQSPVHIHAQVAAVPDRPPVAAVPASRRPALAAEKPTLATSSVVVADPEEQPAEGSLREQLDEARRLISRQEPEKAQHILMELLDDHRKHPEVHLGLGDCALLGKHYEQAIAHYQDALSTKPNYPPAFFRLGKAYKATGDLTQALSWFRKYEEHSPKGKRLARARQEIATLTAEVESLDTRQAEFPTPIF